MKQEDVLEISESLFGEKCTNLHDTVYDFPKEIPVVNKSTELDIKEQWKIFCRNLYKTLLKMELKAEKEFIQSRKIGIPFSERKILVKKLLWCKVEKSNIEESVKDRPFVLDSIDYEIIMDKGYEYWFRWYDDYLWILHKGYPLDTAKLIE